MSGLEGLLAGRTLGGRYHVEAVIGRGGMGAVYRATDQRLGRPVAVKVVIVHGGDAEARGRLRQRFHREAQAAARLRHPNVVAAYDFGTDPELGLDYFVMELLDGEDLAALLARSGGGPTHIALDILDQAARGLAAGHRAGLVHRDVKPGNLFLARGEWAEEVQVKVLDFGIAQVAAEDLTLTHLTVAGRGPLSPAYASPEQFQGETRLTPASDVFSLGAVALHLLLGEKSLSGVPDPARREAEAAAGLARLATVPGVSPEVREVIGRSLAPRPGDRFPDAAAFRAALVAARRGETAHDLILAEPPAPPPVAAPPARRSAWKMALPVAGLLALGVGIYAMERGGDEAPVAGAGEPDSLPPVVVVRPPPADTLTLPEVPPPPDSVVMTLPPESVPLAGPLPVETAPAEVPDRVYGVEEVDEAPELRNRREVRRRLAREYPRLLRRQGVPGQTQVQLVIDPEGRVEPGSIQVFFSTDPAFEEPARRVVEEMEFSPGRLGGRPVRVRAMVPITWNVER
jgi:TonB family protein